MPTAFCCVLAENTAYEFINGYSSEAAAFMDGVRERLGIAGSDVRTFMASDRDYAYAQLDAYVRGYGKAPNLIKVM